MKKPTDEVLDTRTEEEKEQQKLMKEHAQGLAFAFHSFEYNQDCLGTIEGELPVSILYCEEENAGICMSLDSAEALAKDILELVASERAKGVAKA